MDGILLIDKPANLSSFDVIRRLKKKFHLDKIGHAGTLDPFATGLLVILIGKATKLSDYLLHEHKSYRTIFTFGTHTNTYDYTGEVLKTQDKEISKKDIEKALQSLKHYQQEPPMFSAIKIHGKKLYELARQDIEVERSKKEVFLSDINIVSYIYPDLELELTVSKGTYIRSLAVDLAHKLDHVAHVKSLRRLKSGALSVIHSKTLDEVSLDDLISIQDVLSGYDYITVSDFIASKIPFGLSLDERQYNKDSMFVVKNVKGDIIALYKPYGDKVYKPILLLT